MSTRWIPKVAEKKAIAPSSTSPIAPSSTSPIGRRRIVTAPPMVREGGTLVFAYGSNTREEQMQARCPSARMVEVARLPEHSLSFVGFSLGRGGAVATVEPEPQDSVEGVVYRVSEKDLLRLDSFEGAPLVYDRAAMVIRGSKMSYRAWVYQHKHPVPGAPSYRYLAAIVEGRARVGLASEPVVEAAERGAQVASEAEQTEWDFAGVDADDENDAGVA